MRASTRSGPAPGRAAPLGPLGPLGLCAGFCLALSLGLRGSATRPQDPPAGAAPVAFDPQELARIARHSPLPPVPADPTNRVADDARAARLGQYLFFETRLSGNGDVSCATCHDPARSFSDGLTRRWVGMRHTQSLWNAGHNRWLFWDGRADSLWAQALREIEEPLEFAGDRLRVAHLLVDDPVLKSAYEGLFGPLPDLSDQERFPRSGRPVPDDPRDPLNVTWTSMAAADRSAVDRVFADVGKAIAAYERLLVSERSPFDVFAEGLRDGDQQKESALSASAQRGLALFVGRANCRFCHVGPHFSDGEFHGIGVPPLAGGVPGDRGRYDGERLVLADPFNARGEHSDRRSGPQTAKLDLPLASAETWGQFKTPSLRNVARTPPYMHQGQLATLRDVVRFYSTLEGAVPVDHHQETILTPLFLSEQEIDDLVSLLESLSDEDLDPRLTRKPPSPRP